MRSLQKILGDPVCRPLVAKIFMKLQTKPIICYNGHMAYVVEKFKSLFWDCNITRIDINVHRKYIIERILEYGDNEPVKWMFKTYPLQEVKKVLQESRALSKKSSNFWRLVLQNEAVPPPSLHGPGKKKESIKDV